MSKLRSGGIEGVSSLAGRCVYFMSPHKSSIEKLYPSYFELCCSYVPGVVISPAARDRDIWKSIRAAKVDPVKLNMASRCILMLSK